MLNLAIIIPARGGSKRVPFKNIHLLNGRPLISYTIEAAIKAKVTSNIFVSTENDKIAGIAQNDGARIIIRPSILASDEASTEEVLLHSIGLMKEQGLYPDWIITLPPTSPLRSHKTIQQSVKIINDIPKDIDCIFSVHENRNDFWQGEPKNGLKRLFPDASRRQQDREPLWEENSAFYITRTKALKKTGFILGNKMIGFPIPFEESIDINTPIDFIIAETFLKKRS